jgi:salicylate biosynthesis isochorismate synthase
MPANAPARSERSDPRGSDLASALREGVRRAGLSGRAVLVSATVTAEPRSALDVFAAGAYLARERFLWSRPSSEQSLTGLGTAVGMRLTGGARFAEASAAWQQLLDDAVIVGGGPGPVLVGGFAFDPSRERTAVWSAFPDGLLVLPRLVFKQAAGESWLTCNTLVWPGDDAAALALELELDEQALLASQAEWAARPTVESVRTVLPRSKWKDLVADIVRAIDASGGAVEKVVLARECRAEADAAFDPAVVLERLLVEYPTCTVFALAREDQCFLGATPERLVDVRDGVASTMALAGSIGRGATEAQDRRLAERLLASHKDQAEHAVVVRALEESLGAVCSVVESDPAPSVLKVRNVQHLLTRVHGRSEPGRSILDLVERLHPTPAVGGFPRDRALAMIRECEDLDRGWYAGPVGWLDRHGEGEFAVAIRSALIRGQSASLFAGCGIVAESEPAAEYAESLLKLKPMLSALGAEA